MNQKIYKSYPNSQRCLTIINRERSLPIKWFDLFNIDPLILKSLIKGTYQAIIPLNPTHSLGEIAKSKYPSEEFKFTSDPPNPLKTLIP